MLAFVGPRIRLRYRLDHLAVAATNRFQSTKAWLRGRLEAVHSDERGLTTAEYVALGAVVVVAAGAVGAVIANFIASRGAQITGTQ
jgi:hypothetical protein